ncbi:maf-like protein [Sphaeroforma arctica JP610]|uniref:Maf-like protein n=1 Tax=Sphaeroforma arctica JP610 TaxID=667725 RepID=A0A0L0FXD0_9EUKA|nr:maf-like protein [Sphaeroforma arctica JP610]KNC81500.1 maf-like protein [Sphaeroforma arctica JP610]|eukprot:XP_014155402.1 maf-like protein [Sphaeroforma arctica JP610]
MRIVLGSTSKSRNELFKLALPEGVHLIDERLNPDIDEKAIRHTDPHKLVLAIANAKADVIEAQAKPLADMMVTADSVIVFGDAIREKPESEAQAKEFLQSYGKTGIPAKCTTGVVVTNLKNGKRASAVDESLQYFDEIPDEVAHQIIEVGEIMFCAGGFVLEEPLIYPYIGKREGEEEAVRGMPIAATKKLIIDTIAAM